MRLCFLSADVLRTNSVMVAGVGGSGGNGIGSSNGGSGTGGNGGTGGNINLNGGEEGQSSRSIHQIGT